MESDINDSVDVLIVGAGPAGLMMACQLALHNISSRIIDKKASPAIHSGALIVHARTLEILHQMGLAEKAIQSGIVARKINLQFNQKKNFSLDIHDIGNNSTRFPFMLMLEQWQTENMLSQFLNERGLLIENNSSLLNFTQENGLITSQILNSDGSIELIKSRFLIGADGSNSLVRSILNIPFPGKSQQSRLFITDCEARLLSPPDEISFSFASDFTSGFFPLPDNRWRVDGHIPIIQHKEVGFEDIRIFFADQIHLGIELHHPQWFSVFRSHSRCADLFRKKNCFLIGDAAHVHSPVGAQGMNTGLQDAHNLAWKLAMTIAGKASDQLLDTYETERRLLALTIIRTTDRAYLLMTTKSFLIRLLRLKLVPLLLPTLLYWFKKRIKIRNRIFSSISGINIKYKHSFLSDSSSGNFPDSAPKPGERFPYLTYAIDGKQLTVYDGLGSSTFHLFIFGNKLLSDFQEMIDNYGDVISYLYIAKEPGTLNLYQKLGLKEEGCYLVRPDNYIAWRSQELNATSFGNYLQKFLL
ncbi:MAG TPA: FAD-dependent monooxygenase [Prolixibacteraceae bacterium]|jgi:2-polyprenyl-6-methoxyphenol hydroxylase-like FAD-dependent oxidoreductase